jgi:citrate/tricarballylate utilization protein
MGSLEELTRQARELAEGGAHMSAEADTARQLQICNACRYCEGFCAVFPAMTRRLQFDDPDTHFLAHLCHNCGACLHACQYAPPHEFAVNIPRAMARVRQQSYSRYAWPGFMGGFYQRNHLWVALTLALAFAVVLLWSMSDAPRGAGFYALMPHPNMVAAFAPVFLFAVLALAIATWRYARDTRPETPRMPADLGSAAEATHHALTLRYLDGGHGDGCNNANDAFSHARRHAHHLTFYGFMLCFAATSVATLYHYLWGWTAPYDLPSLPKVLGALGGVMLCVGTVGQMVLKLKRHPLHGDPHQNATDFGFMALLLLIAASGLALWAARTSPWLPQVLALHLGSVMALFVTLPYGKMVHGFFRCVALLRHSIEQRQPKTLDLGGEQP